MKFLKKHPFAITAHFERSTVLTFAIPKIQLQAYVPPCLTLDSFQDEYAFLAVALVQTKCLRPLGFPKFWGSNFFLIGYRIFVRYETSTGKRLRGLYILKSETDKVRMKILGNIFTSYNYSTTDINISEGNNTRSFYSKKSNFNIKVSNSNENFRLPENSPFSDWKEARRFAGPLPFTFNFNEDKNEVLIIEGVRSNWQPKPIQVIDYEFNFSKTLKISSMNLSSAFEITDVPYFWKKPKIDTWNPTKR